MKIENTTMNILGTDYEILFTDTDDILISENLDGYTDFDGKKIVIKENEEFTKRHYDTVIRHEMVHAFMFESGLAFNWVHDHAVGHDETTIDWFAIQFPKIYRAFVELDVME